VDIVTSLLAFLFGRSPDGVRQPLTIRINDMSIISGKTYQCNTRSRSYINRQRGWC
jgi:hypothetical protein